MKNNRSVPRRVQPKRRRVLDPITVSVLANRFDAIVREMSNTLLRAARSAVIASARDFSCTIATADDRLLSAAEGIPVHVLGSDLQTRSMRDLHPDLAPGDAFLHNDPYLGNTHAADHTILVPVFFKGRHVFTACAKAHQADIGNSVPSASNAAARDVYEEGALVFPCLRVERNYRTIEDVLRICRARIRVPDQWYGDFLAARGAARIGEKRLVELCAKYGLETIETFVEAWFDYSERRMAQAIRALPKARVTASVAHDPIPPLLPNGVPINVTVAIDPTAGRIEIDLRDNIDNVPLGINQSEASARANAMIGIFNCLDPDLPRNAGSFRRVTIHLREGCVVGKPKFPYSCSLATTNLADRLINAVQSAFAQLSDRHGLADGGTGKNAALSGRDFRQGDRPFVSQIQVVVNGGPAGPDADGWVTYGIPCGGGMIYTESVELAEVKHPVVITHQRMRAGSGGAGRRRGAPASDVAYGPRRDPILVVTASDSQTNPARGVRGGHDGVASAHFKIAADGAATKLAGMARTEIKPGETIRFMNAGGGGYGPPTVREPERVLVDVLRGWETIERARDVYGVVLTGAVTDDTLTVDQRATAACRAALA